MRHQFCLQMDNLIKSSLLVFNAYILVHTDHILLLAPSACEQEHYNMWSYTSSHNITELEHA